LIGHVACKQAQGNRDESFRTTGNAHSVGAAGGG
jgi:hypothetical protein